MSRLNTKRWTNFETYLEKVEEVSNLEIVAIYTDKSEVVIPGTGTNDDEYSPYYNPPIFDPFYDVIHLWGRTHSHPHIYYYRKREQNEWTAWEKMNVEIEGEHFCAVRHSGRLKFFWLTFETKTKEKASKLKENHEESIEKYIKIGVRWTQLVNEKWQPTKVGKKFVEHFDPACLATTALDLTNYTYKLAKPKPGWALNMPPNTIETVNKTIELFQEYLNPYVGIDNSGVVLSLSSRKLWNSLQSLHIYLENKIKTIRDLADSEIIEAALHVIFNSTSSHKLYTNTGYLSVNGNMQDAFNSPDNSWNSFNNISNDYYEKYLSNNQYRPNKFRYEFHDNVNRFDYAYDRNFNLDTVFNNLPFSQSSFVMYPYDEVHLVYQTRVS